MNEILEVCVLSCYILGKNMFMKINDDKCICI